MTALAATVGVMHKKNNSMPFKRRAGIMLLGRGEAHVQRMVLLKGEQRNHSLTEFLFTSSSRQYSIMLTTMLLKLVLFSAAMASIRSINACER